jgi:hypothetical protein
MLGFMVFFDGFSSSFRHSEVFQLDQHGQSSLKLAIQVGFVAGKLLQFVGLQTFTQRLILDGLVVAGRSAASEKNSYSFDSC